VPVVDEMLASLTGFVPYLQGGRLLSQPQLTSQEGRRVTRYRQFVIAPSLARLIQRERGGELVLEGYFPDHPHQNVQNAWVQVEENRSSLVLPDPGPEQHSEERTDLPLASAQALLAVTAGQVEYSRASLTVGSRTVQLQRFTGPAPLDLLLVEVGQEDEGAPLWPWLGPDVTLRTARYP
jgi:CYTH domain-containing protein